MYNKTFNGHLNILLYVIEDLDKERWVIVLILLYNKTFNGHLNILLYVIEDLDKERWVIVLILLYNKTCLQRTPQYPTVCYRRPRQREVGYSSYPSV